MEGVLFLPMLLYPSTDGICLVLLVYLPCVTLQLFMNLCMVHDAQTLQVGGVETQGAHIFQRSRRFYGLHMVYIDGSHHLTLSLA